MGRSDGQPDNDWERYEAYRRNEDRRARKDPSRVFQEFKLNRPDDDKISNVRFVIWLVGAVVLVLLLVSGVAKMNGGSRLEETGEITQTGEISIGTGEVVSVGLGALRIDGNEGVELTSATVVDLPIGLELVDVGIDVSRDRPVALMRGHVRETGRSVVPLPGFQLEPDDPRQPYPVIMLRATASGICDLRGLIVRYRSDSLDQAVLLETRDVIYVEG